MRGKGVTIGKLCEHIRITPACAGKSDLIACCYPVPWDHPRVCGEKLVNSAIPTALWGSPPRVRGKDRRRPDNERDRRITPACAGKSLTYNDAHLPYEDHPRVCGEKIFLISLTMLMTGSPPRVRGKGIREIFIAKKVRITPACAGKSFIRDFGIAFARDHPRVCGEKHNTVEMFYIDLGSPPRVRGKGHAPVPGALPTGITPACAGKSKGDNWEVKCSGDHPRVCGEKYNGFAQSNSK